MQYITKMDTTFMHSENSNIFFAYRLVLILTDRMNLKGRNKYIAL